MKRPDSKEKPSVKIVGARLNPQEETKLKKYMKKTGATSMSEAIRSLIKGLAIAMLLIGCGKSGGSAGGSGGSAPVNNLCAGPLNGTWNRVGFPGHYLQLNADCTGYDYNCGEHFTSGLIQANSTVQITIAANAPGMCRTPGSTVTCNVAANAGLTVIQVNCGSGVETYSR